MDPVSRAFEAVLRADFLPPECKPRAAYDGPLALGWGSTSSQPRTVEDMLRLLAVEPGHRVLDVGAGSGWTTVLLAELCGREGSVLGLEIEPHVAAFGASNVARAGRSWAVLEQALPGVLGDPARAPYDRILVSADATSLPQRLVEQLADGGRLVVPVRGAMTLVVVRDGEVEVSEHGRYSFVPLQ